MLDPACAVVDHAEHNRISLIDAGEDPVCRRRIRHDAAVHIEGTPRVKKSDFDILDPGTNETFKNLDDPVMTECPVVDIAAVAQRAVQQFTSSHRHTLLFCAATYDKGKSLAILFY